MDKNSNLNHIKIQKNSHKMIDISSVMVNQKKESNYDFFQYCDGSELGRNNIHIIMDGNGSNCNLSGISLTKHIQQIDNNIIVEHNGKHTDNISYEEIKKYLYEEFDNWLNENHKT